MGVGLLLGVDAGGGTDALVGGLFVILAAFGYAVGAWYLKRNLSGVEPVAPSPLIAVSTTGSTGSVVPSAAMTVTWQKSRPKRRT